MARAFRTTGRRPIRYDRLRKCPWCGRLTEQIFYDDYRPQKLYAYWLCGRCNREWYRCVVHGDYTSDVCPAVAETVGCTCFRHPGCGPRYWQGCQCARCRAADGENA